MKQLTILITPEGQWVLPDTSEFFAALGDPDPDYDAIGFAVKNLGFIKFSIIDRSIIEIELHPRNVALPAVLSVHQQIQSSGVKLFRIKYFDTAWNSEITSSAEQAMVRLSQLTAPPISAASRDRFVVEPQDYGQLLADEDNELRVMAQKWRMSFGHFDSTLIQYAIKHNLMRQMMIIGVKPREPDPVFRFIGEAHTNWTGSQYRFNGLGEKLTNFPDKDYGNWVAEHYKGVASAGQPRYDHIAATIQRDSAPYYTYYERLMLPWTTPSEEVFVTMFSRRLPDKPDVPKYAASENLESENSAKSA